MKAVLAVAWAVVILILAEATAPIPCGPAWESMRAMAAVCGAPSSAAVAGVVWAVAVWAALQAACFGAGAAAIGWTGRRRRRRSGPPAPATALLLGWLAAGLALLGLAVLGLFRPAVLGPVALLALAGAGSARAVAVEAWRAWTVPAAPAVRAVRWITGAVLAAVAATLLAPETHIDALIYHLGIAGRAVATGRLTAPSGNFLHHFPLLTELLRGWGLALGGEPAARLWTLGGLVAGAAAVRAALAPLSGPAWGWAGFGLWATSPLAEGMAMGGKPDVFTAAFGVAALSALARGGRRGALVAGLLAGAASGSKLQGFVVVPILAVLALRRPGGRRAVAVALVLAGAAAAAGPWLAKSALLTGDPVYPFGKRGWGMTAAAVDQLAEVSGTMALRGRYDGFLRRLAAPWTATMTDGLPALWLALVPLALLGAGRAARPWWIAGALGWIAWSLGPPQPRYAIVPLAWMAVALVAGLAAWRARRAAAMAAAFLVFQAAHSVTACAVEGSWGAGLGLEARDAFRRRTLSTFAETVEGLAALPAGARVMYAGEWRAWPAPRLPVIPSLHEPLPAWPLVRASASPEALARRWRQLGVTHVVQNYAAALYNRGSQTIYPWTPRDLAVWAGFWRTHARLLRAPKRIDRKAGGYYLYELGVGEGPARATPTLPGIEGLYAVVEGFVRRGDTGLAAAGVRTLDRIAGDFAQVAFFVGFVGHGGDPAAEAPYVERAAAGGYRDLLLWQELARLAEAKGRPAEAAAWRRRAADAERPAPRR